MVPKVMKLPVILKNHEFLVFVDTGASYNHIAADWVEILKLETALRVKGRVGNGLV